jgi:MscS family membrane protein
MWPRSESRRRVRAWTSSLRWCAPAILLLLAVIGQGQTLPHQSENAEKDNHAEEPSDPLGRSTPRGTVLGFLHAAKNGDYKEASKYLQLSADEREAEGDSIARQLHALVDHAFVGRVGPVSDHREGSTEAGVPRNRERIGEFRLTGSNVDVELVRVSDPDSDEIWLFSAQTLAAVPELFTQLEVSRIDSGLPGFLVTDRLFSTPLWRWLAFLLMIPTAFGLSWLIVYLLRDGQRIWLRWRHHPVVQDLHQSIAAPSILILTVIFHQIGVAFLGLPLLFRMYYHRVAGVVLVVGATWLVFRLVNKWGEWARTRAQAGSGYRSGAILLLGQRILKALVVIIAVFVVFSIFGFDMTTVIAGLGISGVVVAFAAQKTLENLFGGVSILGDEVIRVGETCRIEGRVGAVEDISLRSTRIRTLERTELSVPNGELASMNIENLSRRDKWLLEKTIGVRCDTTAEQLRSLLKDVRALLDAHPQVDMDPKIASVRLIGFGESSIDIEISCHVLTKELTAFRAIREEILLRIMDLVTKAGTALAVPARAIQVTKDQDQTQVRTRLGQESEPENRSRRAA